MKFLRIIYNILAILIVLSFAFSMVLIFTKTEFYAVATASMEPEIAEGSMVFVRPSEEYLKGDVITAKLKSGGTFTHRIYFVDEENNQVYTMGDNNSAPDPLPTAYSDIIGKVIFTVPLLGNLSLKFNSLYITIGLAGVMVALMLVRFLVFRFKKTKGDEAV